MDTARTATSLLTALLGVLAFGWTAAGETSHPQLAARDLPREVLNECRPLECAPEYEFRTHWAGRTQRGDLFVVSRRACLPDSCSHWLIETRGSVTRVLLELPDAFRFHRAAGHYPAVEVDSRQDEQHLRVHFDWNGDAYVRTRVQRIYAVSGVECGTREQCRALAERALKTHDIDRAQRIWQQVDGVSWI